MYCPFIAIFANFNAVVCRFATLEVMRQYGYVLEQFRSNTQQVNDAIFTMMHHVSGDLGAPEALFVPQILATFSDMWEQVNLA